MQEEQVEIAAGRQFATSVAADGDEGGALDAGRAGAAVNSACSQSSVSRARAALRGGPDRVFS